MRARSSGMIRLIGRATKVNIDNIAPTVAPLMSSVLLSRGGSHWIKVKVRHEPTKNSAVTAQAVVDRHIGNFVLRECVGLTLSPSIANHGSTAISANSPHPFCQPQVRHPAP